MAAFSNILLQTFVRNLVFLASPSLQIMSKTQTGVFPISRYLVNPLSKVIVINPEPVMIMTWNLDQQLSVTKQRQKKSTMMSCRKNLTSLPFFSIYGWFGAIRKPDSGCIVCETYIFINSNLLSYKNWNKTKTFLTQLSHYSFEQKCYFGQKTLILCSKMLIF